MPSADSKIQDVRDLQIYIRNCIWFFLCTFLNCDLRFCLDRPALGFMQAERLRQRRREGSNSRYVKL